MLRAGGWMILRRGCEVQTAAEGRVIMLFSDS